MSSDGQVEALTLCCALAVAYILGLGRGVLLGVTWFERMKGWADVVTDQEADAGSRARVPRPWRVLASWVRERRAGRSHARAAVRGGLT